MKLITIYLVSLVFLSACASTSTNVLAPGMARIDVINDNNLRYVQNVPLAYGTQSFQRSMYTMAQVLEIRNEQTQTIVFKQGNLLSRLFQSKTVDIPAGTYMVTSTCYKKIDGSSEVGLKKRQTSRVEVHGGDRVYLLPPPPNQVRYNGEGCTNQFRTHG